MNRSTSRAPVGLARMDVPRESQPVTGWSIKAQVTAMATGTDKTTGSVSATRRPSRTGRRSRLTAQASSGGTTATTSRRPPRMRSVKPNAAPNCGLCNRVA